MNDQRTIHDHSSSSNFPQTLQAKAKTRMHQDGPSLANSQTGKPEAKKLLNDTKKGISRHLRFDLGGQENADMGGVHRHDHTNNNIAALLGFPASPVDQVDEVI